MNWGKTFSAADAPRVAASEICIGKNQRAEFVKAESGQAGNEDNEIGKADSGEAETEDDASRIIGCEEAGPEDDR